MKRSAREGRFGSFWTKRWISRRSSGSVSKLNPFSTIWCVIENIFLAATAEGLACSMRIPLNEEHGIGKAKLKVPPTYKIPVFIGIGCAAPNETVLEQNAADLDKQLHDGRWK